METIHRARFERRGFTASLFFNPDLAINRRMEELMKTVASRNKRVENCTYPAAFTSHLSGVHEHGERGDRAEIYDVTRKSFRSLSSGRAFRQFMGSRALPA